MSQETAHPMQSLSGRRVLVVEDEYFIANDLRVALEKHGAEVVGPVGLKEEALILLDTGPAIDLAVIDINLQGEYAVEIADVLREQRVPFVFATGYSADAIPSAYLNVPRWEKPYQYETLLEGLISLCTARECVGTKAGRAISGASGA